MQPKDFGKGMVSCEHFQGRVVPTNLVGLKYWYHVKNNRSGIYTLCDFTCFSFPDNYPCVPPIFEIEANQSGSFNYRDADDLFDLLMAESLKRVGEMMVFDLVTFAQDHMTGQACVHLACVLKLEDEEAMLAVQWTPSNPATLGTRHPWDLSKCPD